MFLGLCGIEVSIFPSTFVPNEHITHDKILIGVKGCVKIFSELVQERLSAIISLTQHQSLMYVRVNDRLPQISSCSRSWDTTEYVQVKFSPAIFYLWLLFKTLRNQDGEKLKVPTD